MVQPTQTLSRKMIAEKQQKQHVILFYKYAHLSANKEVMKQYQTSLENLCTSLQLKGRILIGLSSDAEGINGTLSGREKLNVLAFTYALLGESWCNENNICDVKLMNQDKTCNFVLNVLRTFWKECEDFSKLANVPILTMESPEEFKWSTSSVTEEEEGDLFPDLRIKLVKEIINTGGTLSSISINQTSEGYLTPEQWHEKLGRLMQDKQSNGRSELSSLTVDDDENTILIDCRNNKEYTIGHFDRSINPNTKTFEQFPRWVAQNKTILQNKSVLMYCTGGIRCEKASAYIRNETDAKSVFHLKGGIHKYLDMYGKNGFFKGKNFVFDRRIAADAQASENESMTGKNEMTSTKISAEANKSEPTSKENVVGKCLYCSEKHDEFTADGVCTVCRELILICDRCRITLRKEYHCLDHFHLKDCYFTDLSPFSAQDLTSQLQMLEELLEKIAVGKRFKQKRRTLHRQCEKIRTKLEIIDSNKNESSTKSTLLCRNCGESSCSGSCWGFHGLARKEKLHGYRNNAIERDTAAKNRVNDKRKTRISSNKRSSKIMQRNRDIAEMKRLKLSLPPSSYRNPTTCMRCPPPCICVLKSSAKGKWCGKSIATVLQSEFSDLSNRQRLETMMEHSLLRVNGIPVNDKEALKDGVTCTSVVSSDMLLKNMDVLSRIVHWHEPPIIVPDSIHVTMVEIPPLVKKELHNSSNESVNQRSDFTIYCCDKPSTVPVHPAGPYLSNTLTSMVEAQEKLKPRSLLPCHRLDKCTSGLTICCTSPVVARLIQSRMYAQAVSKLYCARVMGHFPVTKKALEETRLQSSDLASWNFISEKNCVEVNAPIHVVDAANGIRVIHIEGKPSISRFSFLGYDKVSDTSLISCCPLTGRGHQLRVHLQWLGFPILNDVQYGGKLINGFGRHCTEFAVNTILEATKLEQCISFEEDKITEQEISAAKAACLSCQGKSGIEQSFNSTQLLESGHAIDLHALRFQIRFERKNKSKKHTGANASECKHLGSIELSTPRPAWVESYGDISIPWLEDLKI